MESLQLALLHSLFCLNSSFHAQSSHSFFQIYLFHVNLPGHGNCALKFHFLSPDSWFPLLNLLPGTSCISLIKDSSDVTCYQPTKASVSGTSFLFPQILPGLPGVSDRLLLSSRISTAWGPRHALPMCVDSPLTMTFSEMPHNGAFQVAAKAPGMTKSEVWREWMITP